MDRFSTPTILYIFLAIGGLLLITSLFFTYQTTTFYLNSFPGQGYVEGFETRNPSYGSSRNSSHGGTTFSYKIAYKTPDLVIHRFTSKSSSSNPSYDAGELIPIRVRFDTNEARVDSLMEILGLPLIATTLGLSFSAMSLLGICFGRTGSGKKRYLQQHGEKIQGKVKEILELGRQTNRNHGHRIIVTAIHPLTGIEQEFKSDIFWSNRNPEIENTTLAVYVDRTNPKSYWIDTSEVQFKINEYQQDDHDQNFIH